MKLNKVERKFPSYFPPYTLEVGPDIKRKDEIKFCEDGLESEFGFIPNHILVYNKNPKKKGFKRVQYANGAIGAKSLGLMSHEVKTVEKIIKKGAKEKTTLYIKGIL